MIRLLLSAILALALSCAQGAVPVDRIVAVVNKEVITYSELSEAVSGAERQLAHAGLHEIGGLKQSGQVVEDVLDVAVGPEADHRQPGGLSLGAHDGEMGADERVQQRGLADVGRAGEGDMACLGHGVKDGVARDAKKDRERWVSTPDLEEKAGDGLLSHHLSVAVPSALQGLTAVFGMGTGVAPAR